MLFVTNVECVLVDVFHVSLKTKVNRQKEIAFWDNLQLVPISQPNHIGFNESGGPLAAQSWTEADNKLQWLVIEPHWSGEFIDPYQHALCKLFLLTIALPDTVVHVYTFDPKLL